MKKIVRTVWISALSGLAFLVACTSQNRLSKSEKKQLKQERTELMAQIEQKQAEAIQYKDAKDLKNKLAAKEEELSLRQRVDEINLILRDEEAREENQSWINGIYEEMNSLHIAIKKFEEQTKIQECVYGPPAINPRLTELERQYDSIMNVIEKREGACVYGSPEVMKKRKEETNRLKKEAEELRKRIELLLNE
ncbi:MAG: hypothetical protein J6P73_09485 [Bacteroidales bacterium]|nr:hypothetical protein [Bacteroidales bacterium]